MLVTPFVSANLAFKKAGEWCSGPPEGISEIHFYSERCRSGHNGDDLKSSVRFFNSPVGSNPTLSAFVCRGFGVNPCNSFQTKSRLEIPLKNYRMSLGYGICDNVKLGVSHIVLEHYPSW